MSPNENSIKLPTPEQILAELPLSPHQESVVQIGRDEIIDILKGISQRKILIAGPCSAWPSEAVLRFASKLAPIAQQVRDKLLIVMRGYIQKPRTTVGWTGPLVYPDPYGKADIAKGIRYCRDMILQVLDTGLPVADEMLFTHNAGYFDDLLSYLAVGARSAEDAEHRYVASALDIPIGIKNPTSGNAEIGVNSLIAAQSRHTFAMAGYQVESSGNPYAHLILRGGSEGPNYSKDAMERAVSHMRKGRVKNPAIIIDASHDNCKIPGTTRKYHNRQPGIIMDTIESMEASQDVGNYLKGWMVESFLEDGRQDHERIPKDQLVYGRSITDPCISFEVLQRAIDEIYAKL